MNNNNNSNDNSMNYIMKYNQNNYTTQNSKKDNINPFNQLSILYPSCFSSDIINSNDSFEFFNEKEPDEKSDFFCFFNIIPDTKNIKEDEKIIKELNNKIENNENKKYKIRKKPLFGIKKEKKLGRLKKYCTKISTHDKFQRDNVIRRFKALFIQNIYNYINISFKCNCNIKGQKPINMIKKVSSYETKLISRKDNIKWLNTKIKNIFAKELSSKYNFYDSNYNINLIKKIYEKKEEEKVIKILEKSIREMWLIYINDDADNEFPGFNTLKYDVDKLRYLEESEEYINNYINISINFENIIANIKPRKRD